LELPLIPVGNPKNDQTNDPRPFLTTNGIEIAWPTLNIKVPGYSMTKPILVLVAYTIV